MQDLLPQYEFLELLGRGGMGAVYKARQKSLNRLVAIKILPPAFADDPLNFAERFKHEAQTIAQLSHPGIVGVHDFGEASGGQLWFAMEYVDGTDVGKMMERAGRLPLDTALNITCRVCEALGHAHRHGVIHRDIKPANILINEEGRVKVADFGLAKTGDHSQDSGLTRTNVAMGTQEFAAPEMRTAGAAGDHRAGIYSLGVMLYQMLTGEIPRVMFKLPSRRQPELGTRFDGVICRALETDPAERYQSAQDFQREMEAAAALPVTKAEPQATHAVTRRRGKKALLLVAAAAALLAGGGMLRRGGGGHDKPVAMVPAAPTPAIEPGTIRLYDEPDHVPHQAGIKWERDAMRLDNGGPVYAGVQSHDMALRAELLMNPDRSSPVMIVRHHSEAKAKGSGGEYHYYGLTSNAREGTLTLHSVHSDSRIFLSEWPLPRAYGPDEWLPIELRAVGDDVTVSAEGKLLGTVHDTSQPGTGSVMLWARARGYFRNIVYVPLDRPAAVQRPPETTAALVAEPAGWIDWLEANQANLPERWISKAEGISTKRDIVGEQILPVGTFDAAARVTYVVGDSKGVKLNLRDQGREELRAYYVAEDDGHGHLNLESEMPGHVHQVLARKPLPEDWSRSTARTLEFRVKGDLLTASLSSSDHRSVTVSVHQARLEWGAGSLVLTRDVLVKKVEVQRLDLEAVAATSLTTPLAFHGHRYQFVPAGCGWTEASTRARNMGGHLAMIDDESKLNWVVRHFGNKALGQQPKRFWIDGSKASASAGWQWHDGTSADATTRLPDPSFTVGKAPSNGGFPGFLTLLHNKDRFYFEDKSDTAVPQVHWRNTIVGFLVEWDSLDTPGPVAELLSSVNVERDSIEGAWSMAADGLAVMKAVPAENGAPRLQLPYEPPEEYDFDLEFTPTAGNGDLKQILCAAGRQFEWTLDSGLANGGRKAGIEDIDGQHIKDRKDGNITREYLLTNGQRYHFRVEVRKDRVCGYLDGEKLLQWAGNYNRLTLPGHSTLRDARHLGLSTWDRAVTFHKIEVREITGRGKLAPFRPPSAGGTEEDAMTDILTSSDCEWTKPVNLGPGVNSDKDEYSVALSDDELVAVVPLYREGRERLCESRRQSVTEPFGEARLIKELDSPSTQGGTFLTADGLTLLYEAGVGPGHQGSKDIYQSHRRDRGSPWEKPVNLGAAVNSKDYDGTPCLSPDGLELLFSSNRPGSLGHGDLWRSRRKTIDASFETPENLGSQVNSEGSESFPRLLADNRTLLFTRTQGGGANKVFLARKDPQGPWTVHPITPPATGAVQALWLSRDGRTLYFSAHLEGGQGGSDLWQARRVRKTLAK